MDGRDRSAFENGLQRGTLSIVQQRRLCRRLAIDQAGRAVSVELQRPVPHDLQRHTADLDCLRARGAVINCRQGQQPTRLEAILRPRRRGSQRGGIEILPKRNRRGEIVSFVMLDQMQGVSGSASLITGSETWYKPGSESLIADSQMCSAASW